MDDDETAPPPEPLLHQLNQRRLQKPLRELPILLREAVRLVWRAAPHDATLIVVVNAITGALTAVQLGLTQRLLQAVLGVDAGEAAASVTPELVAFVVVFTVLATLQLFQNERKRVLSEEVARYSQVLVATAAAEADLIDFERPEFHDRLQRTMANASVRPIDVTYAFMGMVTSVFAVAGVTVALLVVQPILLLLALLAFGPVWLVARRLSRLSYRFDVDETEADRRRSYLMAILTMKSPAKEVRAFELAGHFTERHSTLWDERLDRLRRYTTRRVKLGIVGQLLNGALFAAVVAVLVWLLSTGRTSVSDAAVAAGAILILGQRMGSLVGGAGQLYESALFLADVQGFLDQADARRSASPTARPAAPLTEIAVDDVWFRYPSGEHDALAGVSLSVRPGEVVALVGANGSGKTTLAKVLAQLYQPTRGHVLWNGVDAATLDPIVLRDEIAVIFQDFERYLFTAGENVGFGRSERIDDRDAIEDAATRAGVHEFVDQLPSGYATLLGPEFIGGSDLSVGQWQRIAIARAFFRDARLVILDEPSSALDPDAEAALFQRVRELCVGKAVVIVSHRFSTVTSADRIYVLDHGKIIESSPELASGVVVRASPLNRLKPLRRNHRAALPFLASTFVRTRVDARVVMCSSSGWAHGISTPGRKIVYCHNPPRWLYQIPDFAPTGERPLWRSAATVMRPYLLRWDQRAAASCHRYVAVSSVVARRIGEIYGVNAEVLPPPTTLDVNGPCCELGSVDPGFVLYAGRLVPHKNVGAVVEAFASLPALRLLIVGDGPERQRLAAAAPPNVQLVGRVSDANLRWAYTNCQGVVSASREDFGLVPLEAGAFGKPAAVLRFGGFLDTMVEGETAAFFDAAAPRAIARAVTDLCSSRWDQERIRANADRFAEPRFIDMLRSIALEELSATL